MSDAIVYQCTKCRITKPIEQFTPHKKLKTGHRRQCKTCCNEYSAAHYQKNKEKYDAKSSLWAKAHPERCAEFSRNWRENNPDWHRDYVKNNPVRAKAHNALGSALRSGALTMQPCEICGSEKTDGHHNRYDKPLDVRWLCRKHHKQWHAENGPGVNG